MLKNHDLHVEYLDTKRHAGGRYLDLIRQLIAEKYRRIDIDVVISSDDHALAFLLENRDRLFPEIPIVFCGVNDDSKDLLAGHRQITGVMEASDIRQTIDVAFRLHPSARKMVIVNDASKTGRAHKKVLERELTTFAGRLAFEYLEALTIADLLTEIERLPSQTIVLLMSFNQDAAGQFEDSDTSMALISQKSPVPIYGIWDFYLGKGIVGGKLTGGRAQGETAAAIAMKIIAGQSPDRIPIITQSTNRWMFDHRQLLRFDIDKSRLPADSQIINGPRSIYRDYRAFIWSFACAIFALAVLSIFLLANIEKRKKVEQDLRDNQRLLDRITRNIPGVVYRFFATADRQFGLTYLTDRSVDIFGLDAEPSTFFDAFVQCIPQNESKAFLDSINESVERLAPWHYEGRFIRPDSGRKMWFSGNSVPHVDGDNIVFDGVLLDTTALKQAELSLRRSEHRLRRIIDIVPSMIFVKNGKGRFLMANQAVADSYGMTIDELEGKLHQELHPDDEQVARMLADDRKALESGQTLFVIEEPYLDSGGATRWLETIKVPCDADDFGEPAIVGLATDITERRAVEVRIQESEKRYRTMFENTGTGTVLSETDTTLSMVNSEFSRMVGYTRKAIEGQMSWTRFIAAEDIARMRGYHDARRKDPSSAPTQWECDIVHRTGEVRRMLVKVSLIPGTQTSIGSFLDISDLKKAERALVDANHMLRLVVDAIPVRVFWKDRSLRYLGANQAFAEDAGLGAPEDLIGKDDYEMGWVDQAELYRKDDRAVIASGKARIDYEEAQTTPDGDSLWLRTSKVPIRDAQGQIFGVLGTYQDITERKRADEELNRLRNYLSNIINSMPSVLVGVDAEGHVTQWNKQAERATGISFEKARSQPLQTVFPTLIDEMERVKKAIAERQIIKKLKVSRPSEGDNRFEEVTIFPLVANGVEGAVIRVDDVTERVRMEEMMIQSEKMLSVGGLAAGMAHEINNPLAGILQNAAVLKNRLFADLPANQKAAETAGITMAAIQHYLELRKLPTMLENIHDSGKRAAAIVRNMLSFARKSDHAVSSHRLGDLLDQTIQLAQTDYDMKKHYDFKQIHIARHYDETVGPIPCEGSKLQQVFLNILKNGAEAMADAGTKRHPAFSLRVEDDGAWVRVEIGDNGPGLDERTRRRIFEPFFTTKSVGQGTGLGLSVSYFIITENHGGKMDVFSAPGEGTRFVIRLPKAGKT